MQPVTIKAQFPDTCIPVLEHPEGVFLLVPLTAEETVHMGNVLNGIAEHLGFNLRCLQTLKELVETKGDPGKHVQDLVLKMLEPAGAANELFDHVRLLLGRAIIFKNGKPGGRKQ